MISYVLNWYCVYLSELYSRESFDGWYCIFEEWYGIKKDTSVSLNTFCVYVMGKLNFRFIGVSLSESHSSWWSMVCRRWTVACMDGK